MSPKAELVKQISANGFKEAIDLMACLAVLREGESLILPRTLEAANATRAAIIVQRALLQRVLMTVERAFAPANRPKSDRHARVAFTHLSDRNVFDEVAPVVAPAALVCSSIPCSSKLCRPTIRGGYSRRTADFQCGSSAGRDPEEVPLTWGWVNPLPPAGSRRITAIGCRLPVAANEFR